METMQSLTMMMALGALFLLVNGQYVGDEENNVFVLSRSKCKQKLMAEIMRMCGVVHNPPRLRRKDPDSSRHSLPPDVLITTSPDDLPGLPARWRSLEDIRNTNRFLAERSQSEAQIDSFRVWELCCRKGRTCDLRYACSDEDD